MIKLLQPAYINKVFNNFYLDKTHAVKILMTKTTFLKQKTEEEVLQSKKEYYVGIMRSFMFSMVEIRSNIGFAISVASCFTKNPGQKHIKAVKQSYNT